MYIVSQPEENRTHSLSQHTSESLLSISQSETIPRKNECLNLLRFLDQTKY